LINLFAARPPIEYLAPVSKRPMPAYTGVAKFMTYFKPPNEDPPPEPLKILNRDERRAQRRREKLEKEKERIEREIKDWDPHSNPKATDEAYKTLFVCRLSYNTTESRLKREFEQFGPVKQVKVVHDLDNKPKGYAFIEFERERDMRDAYKAADAKKIDERRILVDVERGRTVKDWRPRRFGGGLGGTRIGSEKVNVRHSARQTYESDRQGGRRDDDRRREDDRRRDEERRRDDDRHRTDRHQHRDERHRDDNRYRRDDRPHDRYRDERPRDDRPRDDRQRDERPRDDRFRDDRQRDERPRDDRGHRDSRHGGRDERREKRDRDDDRDGDRNVRSRRS
jgi:U1 small nuclear ribonucleoprotein